MKKRTIYAADLFCGAGGTSQGLLMAANALHADLELIAINHWQVAVDTHSVNHPYAKHLCTGLDEIGDPRKLVPGGRLHVLCGSPECTHHSVARGGKPMSDQSRSSAWHILRFAEALYIDNLIIENVPEFQSWGPLGANGRPLKSKRGQLFQQFIASLKALGYRVEYRVLNCADFGDPTTRRRLFIMARRGSKPIHWPEPTHLPASKLLNPGLFAEARKPWRTAREIIDWTIPSKSIFERKRPLADKTLLRIQAGLKKFCGIDVDLKRCFAEDLRPFLVVLRGTATTASVDEPLQTVTANGNHYGLVEPFVMATDQMGGNGSYARAVDSPVGTLVTKANQAVVEPFIVGAGGPTRHGKPCGIEEPMQVVLTRNHSHLVEPFIVPQGRWHDPRNIERPLDSITTTSRGVGLAQPFLAHFRGDHAGKADGATRTSSLNDPLPTQDTSNRFGLAEPFLVPHHGEREGQEPRTHSVDEPAPAVTTSNPHLVEPFMVTVNHGDGDTTRRARSIDQPLQTTTSKIGDGICQPFLIAYYGTKNMSASGEPLPTVTARDRFGLVEAEVTHYRLDIRFRMLQPRELARAQGFPDEYIFTGSREDVVKQIGNAVPPGTAMALAMEVLA